MKQHYALFHALLACALFTVQSEISFAEDMPVYAEVDGWTIGIDSTLNNGCFVMSYWEEGTVFRLGKNNKDKSLYVIFGNSDWKSIEYGKDYDVKVQFGNAEKWTGAATGFSFDPPENQEFLSIVIDTGDTGADFLAEFMEKKSVALFYNSKSIAYLTLKGSYQAGLKLFECQEVMDSIENKDPFATPFSNSDPFAT